MALAERRGTNGPLATIDLAQPLVALLQSHPLILHHAPGRRDRIFGGLFSGVVSARQVGRTTMVFDGV